MIPQPLSRDAQIADILRRLNDLESSPDLNGATITGGIIRTSATAPRIEIRADLWDQGWQGIRMYDTSGNQGFPEIKSSSAGSMYLSSGEVTQNVSGNSEVHLDPGGSWYLGSTHLTDDVYVKSDGTSITAEAKNGYVWIRAYQGDLNLNAQAGTVWLVSQTGDVQIECGPTGGVYLAQTGATVSGVTSNVYMDPTSGKLSRIA